MTEPAAPDPRLPSTPAEWREAPVEARDSEAFILRCKGYSFAEIASKIGYAGPQGAQASYLRGLKRRVDEPDPGHRVVDAERLENLIGGLSKAIDGMRAEQPLFLLTETAHDSVDRLCKLMARKAALLGMDAPTKIAPTDPTGEHEYAGLPDDERAARLAAILDAARARRDGSAAPEGGAGPPVAAEPGKPPAV